MKLMMVERQKKSLFSEVNHKDRDHKVLVLNQARKVLDNKALDLDIGHKLQVLAQDRKDPAHKPQHLNQTVKVQNNKAQDSVQVHPDRARRALDLANDQRNLALKVQDSNQI